MTLSAPEPAGEATPPRAPRRGYVLAVLTAAYVCSYLDRSVINIVLPQLKREFHLGDTQLGFLSGLAFALFYVIFGLPVASLADRSNRRNLIAASVALWSVMTAFCGVSTTFLQLAAARFGVGVGEAGLSPPAQSIICDLYSEKRRATALAVYSVGIYIGVLVGLAWGGHVAEAFGWRATFLIMAIPGLVVAALIAFTVKEPARIGSREAAKDASGGDFLSLLRLLWVTPASRYCLIGIAFCSLFTQGMGAWLPSFLVRYHHLKLGQGGLLLGITGGGGGGIGALAGGWLSDRLGARDARWRAWVVAAAFVPLPISALIFLYTDDLRVLAVTAMANAVLAGVHLAPTLAVVQNLTPRRMRARAVAVILFLITIIGGGLGPLAIGALSDRLTAVLGAAGLRVALTVLVLSVIASALCYLAAGLGLAAGRGRGNLASLWAPPQRPQPPAPRQVPSAGERREP